MHHIVQATSLFSNQQFFVEAIMPAKAVGQLCKRCNALEAALVVRSEPLCRDCFAKYVHTKVVKRMEAFRTRHVGAGQERKLLLPMSFGISSVTLLHILDKHLQTQRQKTGRTGFAIHVLHIRSPGIPDFSSNFEAMIKAYPEHEYSSLDLHSLFTDPAALDTILSSLPSSTSVSDILTILRTRLTVSLAKSHDCEGILLGHSTTALAERILSTTALGRGFSLPWQVSDGPSPYGVSMYYPLRDVLRKELLSHCLICFPQLQGLVDPRAFEEVKVPVSKKDTSIEALMRGYFEDVEEGYPSIVSNVVRTAGKLEERALGEGDVVCRLCALPVEEGRMGIAGWGGHQEEGGVESKEGSELCYGCSRSLPKELTVLLP